MKREVLRMERVTCIKNGREVLNNFNFQMFEGEVMGLVPLDSYGLNEFVDCVQNNSCLLYTSRVILSGIHEYYEPEELVGKTCIAIVNLPPRKMMGIDSEGMLISAVHEEDGHEGLNLLMVDAHIPAGAKLY